MAAAPRHPDRLYAASDGGGSDRGGLWASTDGGAHFASLAPPQPEVTALAVSSDDAPQLVVATFRPSDHAAALWTYHDAGGQLLPVGPGPIGLPVVGDTTVPAGGEGGELLLSPTHWLVGSGGDLRETVNGGRTWTSRQLLAAGSWLTLVQRDSMDQHAIWLQIGAARLVRSLDGGRTWFVVQPPMSSQLAPRPLPS